jgi:hypothetical protein
MIKIEVYKIKICGLDQYEVRVNGTLHSTTWSKDKALITANTIKLKIENK